MKITDNDIKVLNKIKKLCNERECEECEFDTHNDCILQSPPNWWELDKVKKFEKEG